MTILTAAPLFAGAVTAGADISKGKPPRLRILFGSVAVAVLLSLFGRVAGSLARALAGVIILGVMIGPGYDLLQSLTRLVSAK